MIKKIYIEVFVKACICTTFFIPLIFIPASYIFPFIVPKILAFRTLVVCMLGGYALLLLGNWHAHRPRLNPLHIAVGLFFLSATISTFFGVDWYRSFWDNHERMLGLFTLLHYGAYYLILSSVIEKDNNSFLFLRVFFFAGILVMGIGLFQKFVDPSAFLNQGKESVIGTLGNSIYFGGYALFLFFISIVLLLKEQWKTWRWCLCVCGGVISLIGIFISGSRGAFLGLFVGIVTLFILYTIIFWKKKKIRNAMLAIFLFGSALFAFFIFFRSTPVIRSIPVLGHLLNSSFSEGTGRTRIMAWQIAIEGWRERPVFGFGPNNYYVAFNKYYRPEFLEHGISETWFDNAHNIILNTLAVQGAVGLLIYLSLFISAWFILYKQYKEFNDVHTPVIIAGFLFAHLIQNIFVFENPTSYLYFFFLLAFIVGRDSVERPFLDKNKYYYASPFIAIPLSMVIGLFIFVTDIKTSRANKATLEFIRALQIETNIDVENVMNFYHSIESISSIHIDDIRNDFARHGGLLVNRLIEAERKEDAKKLFLAINKELSKNTVFLHPHDIRVHILQAQLQHNMAPVMDDSTIWTLSAEQLLIDALSQSPKRQQIIYQLVGVKVMLQKNEEAEKLLRHSIELDYRIAEGWWRLLILYHTIGKHELAQKTLKEMEKFDDIIVTEYDQPILKNISSIIRALSSS